MQTANVKCALRTLYEEIAEFRFDYPLMAIPEAGPKNSLHYYVCKYRKTPYFRPVMRLDPKGIAQVWGRTTGVVYRPAFVAMYGLGSLGRYLRTGDESHLRIFLNQVDWLEQHAVTRPDGAVVWPQNFDLQEGPLILKAPWLSANVQGFVMSALIRAWRITGRQSLIRLVKGAALVFKLDSQCNGIRVQQEGRIVYSEIPGMAAPGIMDGFMRSLLGLYDLYIETGDSEVCDFFSEGVEGLRYFLPRWDYLNKWSWYGNRTYLSPPSYHALNRVLLTVLARLTGESCFAEYAQRWHPDHLSDLERAEIYVSCQLTKNACRVRNHTWHQKAVTANASEPARQYLAIGDAA